MSSKPKPPSRLSAEAKKFWNEIVAEYAVEDSAAAPAPDRLREPSTCLRRAEEAGAG